MPRPVEPEELAEKLLTEVEALRKERLELCNRMTVLFYLLMRDHLPVGAVNDLLMQCVSKDVPFFSDSILQAKARSAVTQLVDGTYMVKHEKAYLDRELKINLDRCGSELAEWFDKHTNALGGGPTTPPKPIETDAKVEKA